MDFDYDTPEFRALITERIKNAEATMHANLERSLFGDLTIEPLPPPSLARRFRRMIQRIRWFFQSRIVGVWCVLRSGQCDQCDHDDW